MGSLPLLTLIVKLLVKSDHACFTYMFFLSLPPLASSNGKPLACVIWSHVFIPILLVLISNYYIQNTHD